MEEKRPPRGLSAIAIINISIFGLIALIFLIRLNTNPQIHKQILSEMSFNEEIKLDEERIRSFSLIGAAIPLLYIFSGAGLLFKKRWAARLTLYFAFFYVALVLLTVLFNPVAIQHAFLQIIYPGILIFYFTNKNGEEYFKK